MNSVFFGPIVCIYTLVIIVKILAKTNLFMIMFSSPSIKFNM
jgi:hypothetical protein